MRNGPDRSEIEFVEFVQWTADRQLRACKALADKLGMKVGLYLDVAVGVQSDGFDAWNEQEAISRHLAVGAPPDPLNTLGQNWGLAGFNAAGLEMQVVRAVPRDAARLDAPCRRDPARSRARPEAALSGAARLSGARTAPMCRCRWRRCLPSPRWKASRIKCVVIGEDLGTVPEGFREQMAEWGIWSYLV